MTEMWPLWTYVIGYVLCWRYHVGFFMHDMAWGEPEGEDLAYGLAVGTLACIAWPVNLSARVVYVLWMKHIDGRVATLSGFFPNLKEVETAGEKQARKAREAREQITARRREINEHARANGLTLTRWSE